MTSPTRTRKKEKQLGGSESAYSVSRQKRHNSSQPKQGCGTEQEDHLLGRIQRTHGNQAVQRLVNERIRPKLKVGQPDDEYECEANQVADHVMRMPENHVPRTPKETMEESSAPSLTSVISSEGRPLDQNARSFFEPRFGRDFSDVRIHTGTDAAASARAINARAYTVGPDIVFDGGQYRPNTPAGRRLLAHELTHIVQQSSSDESDLVRRDAPLRLARQPTNNPVLTPEELFEIIVRERAWTFNRGGAPVEDPAGVGRGVGPAAGGRRAGHAVFAVIQVTDRNGNPVALTYGEHIRYGGPHAEEGAVSALRRTVPEGADLAGGRMTVVLDQVPCPPGRRNCLGLLTSYARQHGLELDIRLPIREDIRGGGNVRPRTAAMGSQRTDMPAWRLEPYQPSSTGGPAGPSPGPSTGGGGGRALSPVVPRRQVPPAPPALVRERANLVSTFERQTYRSGRFNRRLSTYVGIAGRLFDVLDLISTASDALRLASEGTVLGDAERQADQVVEQARYAKNWAEETYDSISLQTATILVGDALERGDTDALFDLGSTFGDLADELRGPVEQSRELSQRFTAQAAALDVMKEFYEQLVTVPQGVTTAPNAQAFAMYTSLERLSGRVKSAAAYYEEANGLLTFLQTYLSDLSHRANREAWGLTFSGIVQTLAEVERQQEAAASAERRIELRLRIIENEARVAKPVSLPAQELEVLHQERQQLLEELKALGGP